MTDNKLIFKNTMVLYIKLIVSSIFGLLASRFTIDALGLSDFGLYSVVGGIVTIFAFVNTIMVATTYRFIAFELGTGNLKAVNEIFNISLLIHIVLAILVLVLNEIAGVYYARNYLNVDIAKIDDAVMVLRLSALATSFSILSIPHQGLLTAHENFLFRSVVETVRSFLGLLISIVLLYYSGNRLILFAVLIGVANVVPTIAYLIYCQRKYAEQVSLKLYRNFEKYKEILFFSGWNTIGAAASVAQSTGTPIVINSFFGTTMNAAYSIGSQVRAIISQFAMNLAQAAVPQITKSYSSGNSDRSINIVSYTSKYTWFLMLFPTLPLLLETEFFLKLWLVNIPEYAVIFTKLLLVFTLANGLGNGTMAIVQATGRIKYFQLILSTTTLIGLPIGYYFYTIGFSADSIVYIFIFTSLTNAFVIQLLLNKLLKFDIKSFLITSYLRVFYVILVLIPLFVLVHFVQAGLYRAIFSTIFSLLYLVLCIYFVGLDKMERAYITNFIKSKSKKILNRSK